MDHHQAQRLQIEPTEHSTTDGTDWTDTGEEPEDPHPNRPITILCIYIDNIHNTNSTDRLTTHRGAASKMGPVGGRGTFLRDEVGFQAGFECGESQMDWEGGGVPEKRQEKTPSPKILSLKGDKVSLNVEEDRRARERWSERWGGIRCEYFETDAMFDGELVKGLKNRSDAVMGPGVDEKAGSRI